MIDQQRDAIVVVKILCRDGKWDECNRQGNKGDEKNTAGVDDPSFGIPTRRDLGYQTTRFVTSHIHPPHLQRRTTQWLTALRIPECIQ